VKALYRWYNADPEVESPGPHLLRLTREGSASVVVVAETDVPVDPMLWRRAWQLVEAAEEERKALREAGYQVD